MGTLSSLRNRSSLPEIHGYRWRGELNGGAVDPAGVRSGSAAVSALQRGMQGGRNSGKAMTYGEAYQRLFPMAVEELA